MIHISEQEVRRHLSMEIALDLVEHGFRRLDGGSVVNHPRRRLVLEHGTVLHYMAAGDQGEGYLGAKLYSTDPHTGAHFIVLLFDAATGVPLATVDANVLGQVRTGAASGIATKFMARQDAQICGIVGSGFQAQTQLLAVHTVRPLRRAKVYSRNADRRARFAERMSAQLDVNVDAVETAEEAVRGSGILVTVTNSRLPVLHGEWLEPGTHINAAGSNHSKRRELDAEAVARASRIATDSVEQARMEAGDLIQAVEEGVLHWSRVQELSAIVAGRVPGRESAEEITVFESQGLAMEDIAAAGYVYERLAGKKS